MNRKHTLKLFIIIQQVLVIIGITGVILSLAQLGDASLPSFRRNSTLATKTNQNASNQEKQTKTKEDIEKMQTEKQVSMKKLNNPKFVPRAVSHMGCIEGCLKYLGIDVSPGWLYGSTGHAFVMSIGTDLCGSGPHCWHWGTVNKLGKNIGYKTEVIYTNKSKDDFAQMQEKAWDFARKSIDDGFPCYGWHYEFLVINGYDDNAYLFSGPIEEHYKLVRDSLKEVEKLFPYANATKEEWKQNMGDKERRQKAVKLLKKAKAAEAAGLESFEKIVAVL